MSTSTTILTSEHKKSTTKLTRFVTLCGRIVHADPAYFLHIEYHGRTIYLCTESCLGAFLADPNVFYKAHRKSDKKRRAHNMLNSAVKTISNRFPDQKQVNSTCKGGDIQ